MQKLHEDKRFAAKINKLFLIVAIIDNKKEMNNFTSTKWNWCTFIWTLKLSKED